MRRERERKKERDRERQRRREKERRRERDRERERGKEGEMSGWGGDVEAWVKVESRWVTGVVSCYGVACDTSGVNLVCQPLG